MYQQDLSSHRSFTKLKPMNPRNSRGEHFIYYLFYKLIIGPLGISLQPAVLPVFTILAGPAGEAAVDYKTLTKSSTRVISPILQSFRRSLFVLFLFSFSSSMVGLSQQKGVAGPVASLQEPKRRHEDA